MGVGGFIRVAERAGTTDLGVPHEIALDAAYQLGRGEARGGRSMDALQAAYRIGARVSWRSQSGCPRRRWRVGRRDRAVRRDGVRVHRRAVGGERRGPRRRARDHRPRPRAAARAARPAARRRRLGRGARGRRRRCGLGPAGDAHGGRAAGGAAAGGRLQARPADAAPSGRCRRRRRRRRSLLVPSADGARRPPLLAALAGRQAVVGPARPWTAVAVSVRRAGRARPHRRPTRRSIPRPIWRPSSPGRTPKRSPTCACSSCRRWRTCARRRASASPRRCAHGCCTRAAATRSPPTSMCIPRPSATG